MPYEHVSVKGGQRQKFILCLESVANFVKRKNLIKIYIVHPYNDSLLALRGWKFDLILCHFCNACDCGHVHSHTRYVTPCDVDMSASHGVTHMLTIMVCTILEIEIWFLNYHFNPNIAVQHIWTMLTCCNTSKTELLLRVWLKTCPHHMCYNLL